MGKVDADKKEKKKVSKEDFTKRANMIIGIVIGVICIVIVLALFFSNKPAGSSPWSGLEGEKTAVVSIKTDKGDVTLALYPELMPETVNNFLGLVDKGFYNGLKFHRVEDWVIQGGDPKGDGTGGSEKTIKLETNPKLMNWRGAVAMARSTDPNSASSQFYILKNDSPHLNGGYAVFGRVISGMEIIDKIQKDDKMIEVKKMM